ncbi:GID complex subunit containing RING finger motif [Blastocladiella emersonii ATCC 22665]|nr:GID complex subunit containing RING finger motif [Blastocladiella emersonii ATCC 22665]
MSSDKLKLNADAILGLESAFVKLPFEQLRKANRKAQKHTEKEIGNVVTAISDLAKGKGPADPLKALDTYADRLRKLRRKLNELREEEALYVDQVRTRLAHQQALAHIKTQDDPAYASWSHVRLQRLLLDYLLRQGFLESATLLAKGAPPAAATSAGDDPMDTDPPSSGGMVTAGDAKPVSKRLPLEHFADLDFFRQARKIEVALEARRCTEALAWCADNKTALRKQKSTLEFNLRLQEFIDLAAARKLAPALEYAKSHLAPFADTHMASIQQALALLAFPPATQCEPYRSLYDGDARWAALRQQFRADNFALHALPPQSALESTLQAGLSVLKTAQCGRAEDCSANCPVCVAGTYHELARGLPLGHQVNSTYVCRITGALMNEDNPPMVTPDGYVYSRKAVADMAAKNHGMFKCPRTGKVYQARELKKMYLT